MKAIIMKSGVTFFQEDVKYAGDTLTLSHPIEIRVTPETVKYIKPFIFTKETVFTIPNDGVFTTYDLDDTWSNHYQDFKQKLYYSEAEERQIDIEEDDLTEEEFEELSSKKQLH